MECDDEGLEQYLEEQKAKEAALLQKQMEELNPGKTALVASQSPTVRGAQQSTEK